MADLDKNRLNDEELDNINGGMIFNATGREECDPARPWEVLANHNCEILGRFATRQEAEAFAKKYGNDSYNTMEVPWETVQRLRANPNVY